MAEGVDCSFSRPGPAALKAAGRSFIGRYLWYNTASKGISGAEYNLYVSNGVAVFLIYEEDGQELKGGYGAGVAVAQKAEQYRNQQGIPALPIYFCVDFDAAESQQGAINAALQGAASVIGHDRTGLYAGYWVVKRAFDAGVIKYGFQTYAWSGGNWDSRAQIQQYRNGQNINGDVDFCRTTADDFGGSTTLASGGSAPAQSGNITNRSTADIQRALVARGFSVGPSGVDGIWGPDTANGVGQFQASVGITVDKIYGPITDSKLFPASAPSGGVPAPAFPLPAGWYFGPKSGPQQSVSGYYSYRDQLRQWQQRMADRGWTITPDGLYGPQTASIAKQFQQQKGLQVDGLIGPQTWAAAWTTPIT